MRPDFRLHPLPEPQPLRADGGEFSIRSDPALLAEGWVRRHVVGPDRVEESMELYRSLGFEVKAVTLTPADFGPSCQSCAAEICGSYVLIYTRKADHPPGESRGSNPTPA